MRKPSRLRAGLAAAVLAGGTTLGVAASAGPASASTASGVAFPYDPGGVTFYGGLGGGLLTFRIPAGTYVVNVRASYDPATDPSGSGRCLFFGELDYLSGKGSRASIGSIAPIISSVPFHLGPLKGSWPAGDYRIYIYRETTCSWNVEFWRVVSNR